MIFKPVINENEILISAKCVTVIIKYKLKLVCRVVEWVGEQRWYTVVLEFDIYLVVAPTIIIIIKQHSKSKIRSYNIN